MLAVEVMGGRAGGCGVLQPRQRSQSRATQDSGPAVGRREEQTPVSPPYHLDQEPGAPAAWGKGKKKDTARCKKRKEELIGEKKD